MKKAKLEKTIAMQRQQIAEMLPKVSYCNNVLQSPSLVTTSKIAKDYGMSARKLNKLLSELGVQYKLGDLWLLYAKYQDQGYTMTETTVIENEKGSFTHCWMKWTQRGRAFLYELLKENGYSPNSEHPNAA